MPWKNLIYEEKGHIGKIIIHRPEVLNAVDYPTIRELREVLSQIEKNPNIRVMILMGSGDKSFVVGADRNEIKNQWEDENRAIEFEVCCRETFNLIENLGKPSICVMKGYAFGLGLQLSLACTFRIVSDHAKLGLPEMNLGFFPSMGAAQRLTRLIGEAKATEMILTGEPMDGEEAYRIGLVNKKVSSAELEDYAETLASKLAERNPAIVKLAMEAIKRERRVSEEDGSAFETMLSAFCLRTRDAEKGKGAFSEKGEQDLKVK